MHFFSYPWSVRILCIRQSFVKIFFAPKIDDVRYGRQLASPALIYRFNQLLIAIGPKTVMCTAPTHSPLFVYTHMPGYINECAHTPTHTHIYAYAAKICKCKAAHSSVQTARQISYNYIAQDAIKSIF